MLSIPSLKRRMAWDILPCDTVNDFFPKVGLNASAPDGAEIEHEDAHRRLELLAPILGSVHLTTQIASAVIGAAILETHGQGLNDEQKQGVLLATMQRTLTGVQAVLCELLDLGILAYGTGKVDIIK
jgi:hypothetical protein